MKKPIIIAEAGVNHNGKIHIAKKLINLAKKSNANYIKFQFYKTENLVTKNAKLAPYQKKNLRLKLSQMKMLKKYELNINQIKILFNYCKRKKIKFLCTPFDIESAKSLIEIGIREFKISSPDIDNYPLLNTLCKVAKKIFLSSGMSSLKDISNTLDFLKKIGFKKNNICVLHCVSDYPAKKDELNLLAIRLIKNKFKIKTGYSDHSLGDLASISAVVLGAEVIEKHITINKQMTGPDHILSMNKKEFMIFVKSLNDINLILGREIKKITNGEKKNYKQIKRSVYLNKNIKKGEIFRLDHFVCKRPRYKTSSINWSKVLEKKTNINFKKGTFFNI